MTALPNQLQVSFGIIRCNITKFSLTEFALTNKVEIPFDQYSFNFSLNIKIDEPLNQVSVLISSNLSSTNEKKEVKDLLALIDTQNDFTVVNLGQFLTKTPNGDMIPDALVIQIFSVSISALRGVYVAKLEDTIYSNAVVPLLDVSQLLPKKASNVA